MARYIAASASRSSDSGVSCSVAASVPPTLTVQKCSPLSSTSGLGDRGREPLGDVDGAARAVDVGADDDELVAAQARDRVRRADRGGQPGREGQQHLVAGGVTERVVDHLEAVEVEHEHRDVDLLALPAGEREREPVERERAVRQAGERVVQRGVARHLLLAVALDGEHDQRRDRGEERDLVLGELARLAGA